MNTTSKLKKTKKTATANNVVVPLFMDRVPRLGILSWTFIGVVMSAIVILLALAAVSEIVLPMIFAAVLAIAFKPLVGILVRHKLKPGLAAGVVVLGLLILTVGAAVMTVRGVVDQRDQIDASSDAAIATASEQTEVIAVDQASLETAKNAIKDAAPMIATGFLAGIISVFGTLVAIASGIILGSLIMYYLLKDGTSIRQSFVLQVRPESRHELNDFIGQTCRTIRDYGKGRTVMSAIVAAVVGLAALLLGLPLVLTIVVVNFIGGYIPYIGAFLGGGLAVIVALGDGGIPQAIIMLIVVLASNLILENFVEPKIMGKTLDIHPLVVLLVTTFGGLIGGIVGLILAVPAYVIASDAIRRLRSRGIVEKAASRVKPAMRQMLD